MAMPVLLVLGSMLIMQLFVTFPAYAPRSLWRYYALPKDDHDLSQVEIARLDKPSALVYSTVEDVPRIDGATAFYPLFLGVANTIAPTPTSETEKQALSQRSRVSRTINAYERLSLGETDMIFVLKPSPEQAAVAEKRGNPLLLHPIALEAFVFFTRKGNPVQNLTLAQIRDIYSGKIVNWKKIGGSDAKLTAYQRNPNSGSQTVMQSAVMGDTPMALPPGRVSAGMMFIAHEVVAMPYNNGEGALGYSFRFYIMNMQCYKDDVQLFAIEGVPPTPETIADQTYPLTQIVYAVTTKKSHPNCTQVIEWLRSEQGHDLIRRSGYIPLPSPP